VINPAKRWPNGEVPNVIDNVFGEYCSTKLQMRFVGHGGNYPFIMTIDLDAVHTGV